MDDFAGAAMLRLVREGVRAQGINHLPKVPSQTATIPLSTKRGFLVDLLQAHGALSILRIPDVLDWLEPEPTLQALQLASDPVDLMQRWGRLVRFIHSQNRVAWEAPAPGHLLLQHTSLKRGEPPIQAERLLVFATLTKLAELTGNNIVAGPKDGPAWRRGAAWTEDAGQNFGSHWQLRYDIREAKSGGQREWLPSADIADRSRELVARDFNRRWRIEHLAEHFGTSSRSFQRALQNSGTHFSALVDAARLNRAAELLVDPAIALAEIGFTCGFADQPHFSRSFRRSTGLTPALWRQNFAIKAAQRAQQ